MSIRKAFAIFYNTLIWVIFCSYCKTNLEMLVDVVTFLLGYRHTFHLVVVFCEFQFDAFLVPIQNLCFFF
jgi:hypothetical protein